MSEPQTGAGRALLRRGSNNWTGSDWQLTFAANIAKAEAQAHDAALAEAADRLEADILALWTHARRNGFAASSIWVNRHEVLRLIAALRSGGAG